MTRQSFEGRTSSSGNTEFGTPDYIFNPLNEEFHFGFDLAATARSTKVPDRFWTKDDDALSRDWPRDMGWLWLNPPYSRAVRKWIQKAYEEARKGSPNVVLINANTESQWYQHIAVPHAHEIRHLEHRIAFIDWQTIIELESAGATEEKIQEFITEGSGSYHPSCILVFGTDSTVVPVRRTFSDGERFAYVSF